MARALVIAGVIVLALGILFHLVALLVAAAIPIGIVLLIVGGIWLLVEKARQRR